jgi:hypothetical protein
MTTLSDTAEDRVPALTPHDQAVTRGCDNDPLALELLSARIEAT